MSHPAGTIGDPDPYASPQTVRARAEFLTRSWILCAIAMLSVMAATVYIWNDRSRYAQIFADFKLALPGLAKAIIDLPDSVLWGLGVATVAGLLTVQIVSRCKRTVSMIHLAVIVVWCVATIIYQNAMAEVFMSLMIGTAGGGRSP